jgi:hypothetical protein
MKNLTQIITLAAGLAFSLINLNAAEPVLSPKAKADPSKPVPVSTADPELRARKFEVAASPKVLANFPYLARGGKGAPSRLMAVCSCCKH